MKKNTAKKAIEIINSNDTESSIIADVTLSRFNVDYSELELELEELALEKEFQARQRLMQVKKAQTVNVKKSISNKAIRTNENKNRNYEVILSGLLTGVSKKTMISDMVLKGWKEITAKSFVNSCACVLTAIKGESKKTEGIVFQATQCLLNGEKMPIWGDKNSKNYCENVVKAYKLLTAKKA